jgi:hypothetical protein
MPCPFIGRKMFCASPKCLKVVRLKKFGPALNILQPAKGQGISASDKYLPVLTGEIVY